MAQVIVHHYDSFTKQAHMGNPAGVIVGDCHLSPNQMIAVAKTVGFNECAFVLPSETADLRLRYFTPGHEIDLCGHGTVAALTALADVGRWPSNYTDITVETNVGVLPMRIERGSGQISITMGQSPPQFIVFTGDPLEIASAIGLTVDDIVPDMPIVYGNTGIWTLLVPIKTLEAFQRMVPNNAQFPHILAQCPESSIHLFTLETVHDESSMHGRHFSSPRSGTIEDPVTGTSSGVMGAYYAKYIDRTHAPNLHLIVEQGQEIGRDGRVDVYVDRSQQQVKVTIRGTAVKVAEMTVDL